MVKLEFINRACRLEDEICHFGSNTSTKIKAYYIGSHVTEPLVIQCVTLIGNPVRVRVFRLPHPSRSWCILVNFSVELPDGLLEDLEGMRDKLKEVEAAQCRVRSHALSQLFPPSN